MTNRTAQAVLDYVRTEVYKKEEAHVKELQNENIQLRAHTDNGKEFVAAILSIFFFFFFLFSLIKLDQFFEENNIKYTHSLPYCPEMNGKIERVWRTLWPALAALVVKYGDKWYEYVLQLLFFSLILHLFFPYSSKACGRVGKKLQLR